MCGGWVGWGGGCTEYFKLFKPQSNAGPPIIWLPSITTDNLQLAHSCSPCFSCSWLTSRSFWIVHQKQSTFSLKMPHLCLHVLQCGELREWLLWIDFYFSLRLQSVFPQPNRPISHQGDMVHMRVGQQVPTSCVWPGCWQIISNKTEMRKCVLLRCVVFWERQNNLTWQIWNEVYQRARADSSPFGASWIYTL